MRLRVCVSSLSLSLFSLLPSGPSLVALLLGSSLHSDQGRAQSAATPLAGSWTERPNRSAHRRTWAPRMARHSLSLTCMSFQHVDDVSKATATSCWAIIFSTGDSMLAASVSFWSFTHRTDKTQRDTHKEGERERERERPPLRTDWDMRERERYAETETTVSIVLDVDHHHHRRHHACFWTSSIAIFSCCTFEVLCSDLASFGCFSAIIFSAHCLEFGPLSLFLACGSPFLALEYLESPTQGNQDRIQSNATKHRTMGLCQGQATVT